MIAEGGRDMTIHNWIERVLISLFVCLSVFLIVVPHLMDVDPPFLVKALLWPAYLVGPAIGRLLPRGNIGTTEHPVYEGTPIDFLVGFALVGFSIFLYPVVTFVVLSLISRRQARRGQFKNGAV